MIRFAHISLKDFIKKHNPQEPKKETIENFEKEINSLLENAPRQDDEEFQKNEINKFLKNAYGYDCNTSKKVDSAIYVDKEVRVLIEVKALNKKTEFPKNRENPLSKAFCQMVLYFLEEIEKEKNNSLKHTIICNAHEFFLFDCKDLLFLKKDKRIKKFYENYAKKEGTDSSKPKFYKDLEQYLQKDFQGELPYTHFNLSDDFKELPLIYQVLSQEVLLKQRKTLDANTLDKDFYEELLYILGLEEQNEAVGSGHFLVSALNEMVFIAYELGLIASLYRHSLRLENDEIIIIHTPTGEIFNYTKAHSENDPYHQIQKELFELKKSIIENCLFGVDINLNSCEITKLRLWIELLKYSYYIFEYGKNTNMLETLPNIDINIKCANSLISRFNLNDDLKKIPNIKKKIQEYKDLVAQYKDPNPLYPLNKADLINKIQDLKNTFSLTLKDPKTKAELEKTIEKHIKKYNFFALDDKSLLDGLNYIIPSLFGTPKLSPKEEEEAFASYGRIRALRKKLDDALSGGEYQNAFEWRFEFPEVLDDEGDFLGFDCIIGNPPYIRQEQINKPLKSLLEKQYQDFYTSSADIYTYFFALAYHLLKEKGFNAFITSNKYARAKYGAKLRELLLKKTTIVSYMELNALKVFESATVDTSIISFIKQTPPKESRFKYYEPTPDDKNDLKSARSLPMKQNALSTESFIFANTSLLDLRDKIESVGTPLKDWDIQINYGIKTGANEAFIIPTEKREEILNACKTQEERKRTEALIKPILRGKDIKRYSYEWAGEWVINTHNGYTSNLKFKIPPIDIEKYPALKSHLDSHWDTIATRCDQGDTPYHLRNCAYLEDFEKEKIVYGEIVQEPRFYLDNGECELGYFYAEATSFILTGEHLHYLLGMLHSKLITFAFKTFYAGGGLGESGYRYKKAFIERLPIPQITEKNQELADKITDGADRILKAKEKDPKANTQGLEKEIDALVYQLYNLTDEEIKIIENEQ
ncbi:hypothetical protein TH0464_01760 [Helicobacter pylori]